MPYATLADVKEAAPKINLGPSTSPSVDDAEKIIERVNQHLNSVLIGLGYKVPITSALSPQSFAILKDMAVQGAIARILKAMYYGIKDPNDVGANDAWKDYTGKIKALIDPNDPFGLPDAESNIWAQKAITELSSQQMIAAYSDAELNRLTRDQVF